ncbi:MAG TPA: carboxypeptidase-like regulatory domain-containing protein, partial [Terriglobales bacterium]|nr:carboxypeptidase-like regulatory domain-containing protein [Terriglobales bacterium]
MSLAGMGFAQLTATGLHGVVRDPSGAVIPAAKITIKDLGTGIEKSTTAGADGAFAFSNLTAGNYTVTAAHEGFQNAVFAAVEVDSGRITDLAVGLKIGATSQTVEVTGAPAQLQTSTNEIGTTITNKDIQDLPYSSLDTLNFTALMAGSQSAGGRNITFDNLPNASMSITLDGMDN